MASTLEWGWAIGFFEGEGSLRAKWRNNHRNRYDGIQLEMTLVNTDRSCLERFQRIVECGVITPRRNSSPLARKPIWCWAVVDMEDRGEALRLAMEMLPELSEHRRSQFLTALDAIDKQRVLVGDAKQRWHELKLAAIADYKVSGNFNATAQKFGVSAQAVAHWVKGRGMTTHSRNIRRLGAHI